MKLDVRLKRLEANLMPPVKRIHLLGWANCTWSKAEGLEKFEYESKDDFISRVISQAGGKKFIWFD